MSVLVVLHEVRMPFQYETRLNAGYPAQPGGECVDMEVQSLVSAIIGYAPVLVSSRCWSCELRQANLATMMPCLH